jgi:hypothetical protein
MKTPRPYNPNVDCKAGKTYKLGFRTGVRLDKKKETKKRACRLRTKPIEGD